MNQILATIKCPADEVPHIREQLQELGVNMIEEQKVPYEQFIEESYQLACSGRSDHYLSVQWRTPVSYLHFSFDDSAEGREQSYFIEFHLKQIPLNLCYTMS